MIRHIRIRNFKSLHDVEVELGPFNVLIGQNGAGKSSFLHAIQVLSWLVRHRSINDALTTNGLSYSELVYLKSTDSTIHWDVALRVADPKDKGQSFDSQITISVAKRRYVYVTGEVVRPPGMGPGEAVSKGAFGVARIKRQMVAFDGDRHFSYENVSLPHSVLLDASEKAQRFPRLNAIAKELAGFLHYEIWGPELLRRASGGTGSSLAERGDNLPSVLHTVRSRDPDRFSRLVAELRSAYPWLDSIEIRRLGEGRFALSFLERVGDKRKRRVRYQPSQVSDGFLRLLALTTLKYQPTPASILGYEEPENGMHPGMLIESVRRLRDIAASGTQVIVTTHSPFLLQYMLSEDAGGDPRKELKLVWRGTDGRTVVRAPDPKVLEKARAQGIGVGELWTMLLQESEMAEPSSSRHGEN